MPTSPASCAEWVRAWLRCAGAVCALLAAGCSAPWSASSYMPPKIGLVPLPLPQGNPVVVPSLDRDLVWDQVVDVVDDYFRIEREDRVKLVGDLLTEGRIDTYPRSGSTIFEPWNNDTVTPYERWESTLQSIRRIALVRVIPTEGGFLVEVQVRKELEDVPRPESGAISIHNSQALRNDDALRRIANPTAGRQPTLGWIDLGRDAALEQQMLAEIQGRLNCAPIASQF
jgi:hypothetical protein